MELRYSNRNAYLLNPKVYPIWIVCVHLYVCFMHAVHVCIATRAGTHSYKWTCNNMELEVNVCFCFLGFFFHFIYCPPSSFGQGISLDLGLADLNSLATQFSLGMLHL